LSAPLLQSPPIYTQALGYVLSTLVKPGDSGRLLLPEGSSEVGPTVICTVSKGDVGSSPRRQSGGAKDSVFTRSTSPTPGAWMRVRVEQGGRKKERKQEVLRVRAKTKA
jgi:hypothetical protein